MPLMIHIIFRGGSVEDNFLAHGLEFQSVVHQLVRITEYSIILAPRANRQIECALIIFAFLRGVASAYVDHNVRHTRVYLRRESV